MDEIEYMWPVPSAGTIKVYCWMKMLDQYEVARLNRLNIIERPSHQRDKMNNNQREEFLRQMFKEAYYNKRNTRYT